MRDLFFLGAMPFSLANFSHFVSARGWGTGFSRGSAVVAAGSVMTGPSFVFSTGSANNPATSSCVASRACAVSASPVSAGTL